MTPTGNRPTYAECVGRVGACKLALRSAQRINFLCTQDDILMFILISILFILVFFDELERFYRYVILQSLYSFLCRFFTKEPGNDVYRHVFVATTFVCAFSNITPGACCVNGTVKSVLSRLHFTSSRSGLFTRRQPQE